MKRIAFFLVAAAFLFQLAVPGQEARKHAQTLESTKIHVVKEGETVDRLAVKYGVPQKDLKQLNDDGDEKINTGDKIIIPDADVPKDKPQTASKKAKPQKTSQKDILQITPKEKELLARLVHAEAKGEPYEGKVAVAAVVLNRVESDKFPDTVEQVIYQKNQFEPVENGMINKPAGEEAKKAVDEAIAKDGKVTKALFFFNPHKIKHSWLYSRPEIKDIGNHRFTL
ncbi:cell wall hydrolase [Neobacillus sp. PS3-34]|uniref:cell wall hydrolase n=1 Tax=Neobacillus sp. PS3-34 TaxID=3070678 RepID=UPI0027E090A7|nr:cell wall hydrolase [Neobacillus sp. PS3-34]WML49475.1 cell wall hydrolase [Neobacillus sp. PS3-34]